MESEIEIIKCFSKAIANAKKNNFIIDYDAALSFESDFVGKKVTITAQSVEHKYRIYSKTIIVCQAIDVVNSIDNDLSFYLADGSAIIYNVERDRWLFTRKGYEYSLLKLVIK